MNESVKSTPQASVKGALYVVSAPSGAGKTTLVNALADDCDHVVISISHTTRAQRPGEQDGVNYHFVTLAQFQTMLKSDQFLESAQVFDHYYGTARQWVADTRAQGLDVILEIDWQGYAQVIEKCKDAIGIFVLPPSTDALQERLMARGQDSTAVIASRMRQAGREMAHYRDYDYLIVNDEFEQALAALKSIVVAQRLRVSQQAHAHKQLLQELVAFTSER